MTLEECYASMGADYEGVMERLAKEDRVKKYLKNFATLDTNSEMIADLEKESYETAFRNIHNVRGLALNLGLTALEEVTKTLCDSLRGGKPDHDITLELEQFNKLFCEAKNVIGSLDD